MKTRKTIRLILCVVAVLSMALCFTACGENDVIVSSQTTTTNNNVATTTNAAQTTNLSVTTQNQTTTQVLDDTPDMCYWCGELPVGDFETYCVNCRCIKCDNLRKNGGVGYIYCTDHNCNENNCEEPAVDDSQYCVLHKCSYPNCDSEKMVNSEYCYAHSK